MTTAPAARTEAPWWCRWTLWHCPTFT